MKKISLLLSLALSVLSVAAIHPEDKSVEVGFRAPNQTTYVIAHRGAHQNIPENSLAAYKKAIDLGCDFVEIDVRTTKDGHFVSVHNANVEKYVSGVSAEVKDLTLAELKSLDIGEKIGAEWKGTQIPTFEEILQLCQGKIGIYLDLKDAPVDELMLLIKKYNMESDVIWYVPASYFLKMNNVETLFGSSFIMPDPGEEANLDLVLQKLQPKVVATDMSVLSKSFIEKCHRKNVKVFVDEKKGTTEEWKMILEWGTDGIQTDDPERIIDFLKEYW